MSDIACRPVISEANSVKECLDNLTRKLLHEEMLLSTAIEDTISVCPTFRNYDNKSDKMLENNVAEHKAHENDREAKFSSDFDRLVNQEANACNSYVIESRKNFQEVDDETSSVESEISSIEEFKNIGKQVETLEDGKVLKQSAFDCLKEALPTDCEANAIVDTVKNLLKMSESENEIQIQRNILQNEDRDIPLESTDEEPETVLEGDEGLADISDENNNKKNAKSTKGERQKSKKHKQKEDRNAIHSETQRLVRESTISLPYHHPKKMSLKEFLNRKKNSPNVDSTPKNCSTPNNNNCKLDLPQIPLSSGNAKSKEIVMDALEELTTSQTMTPLQELKKNLVDFRKSIYAPVLSASNEKFIDLSDDPQPAGVETLINRFIKHTSKPASPATPKFCALKIVCKEVDEEGKESLKPEIINIKVSPSEFQSLPNTGPKINELKSKLRSVISLKKMKEREKRLLAYKLDNEEGNEFADPLEDEEAMDFDDGINSEDSDDEADESEQSQSENEEQDEESEISGDEECSDDDDVIQFKTKPKKCPFLDDEAEESDEGSINEEPEDFVTEDKTCDQRPDSELENETSPKKIIGEEIHSQESTMAVSRKDADVSFEMIGSLFPAAQPYGGHRFGEKSLVESDSEEEKSTLENNSQEVSLLEEIDSPIQKRFGLSVWNKDESNNDDNELLEFCSGRFTGSTQKPAQDRGLPVLLKEADDSSDDDSTFLVGRKRILNKRNLVIRKANDSEGSDEENLLDDGSKSTGNSAAEQKSNICREFFEEEAELSGSDIGSDDEVESDDDNILEEGLADEILNEDMLRDEIGKVHFKTMLDEDKRELRFFQEMYLEDGDLHSDGQGRERKFRWKTVDDSQNDEGRATDEDEREEEDDENWRVNRHEREMWLQEQKGLLVSPSPKKKLSLNVKLVNRTVSEIPVAEIKTLHKASAKGGSRSFLCRDRQYFSHFAEKFNKPEDDRVGKRATKNFVFRTTSPVKTTKVAVKRTLSSPVIQNAAKKIKTIPQRSNSVFDLF